MKFDAYDTLVREKYDPNGPDWMANLGDSCAETFRYLILSGANTHGSPPFVTENGFVRHPQLIGTPGWSEADFSNDQFLPLLMGQRLANINQLQWVILGFLIFIPGTSTVISLGVFALSRNLFWLLNLSNIVQGWLMRIPFRWSDSTHWFERSEGSVADYLNMVCIYVFLRRMGKWATLPRPADECLAAVRRYYLMGSDAEPNAEWVVELYAKALSNNAPEVLAS